MPIEHKDTIVMHSTTGKRVTNVIRINVTREFGNQLSQPPTAPGQYYAYCLPFQTAGERDLPSMLYLSSSRGGW
jgi:hypothetical protein